MQTPLAQTILGGRYDTAALIEHAERVRADQTLEQVYEAFRRHTRDFAGVVDGERYIGTISRSHLGFLLGARFGFALYARQPVSAHLLPGALAVQVTLPLTQIFQKAFARSGTAFYDDIALLTEDGRYLGMITVKRLIELQSSIIAEQTALTRQHQLELAEKNEQLFRSLNELRQSQGRYEALLKNSALGIVLLNEDGTIETHNPRTEALLGPRPAGAELRWNLADYVVPERRGAFLDLLRRHEADTTGALACEEEFPVLTPHRGERLFRFFTTWIQETGQVCAQFHDVTEQRALERQVALREKLSLFESLVGGIAHELNNKLSPVLGFAELLMESLRHSGATEELINYCNIIRDSSADAAKIIRQLLQLSRPPATERAPCDLAALVAEARDMLAYRLRAEGVEFSLSAPPTPLFILADSSQMKQVIFNIVLNALDAMANSPRKRLRARLRAEDQQVILSISDTGHGIRPEHLNRVFDPFFTTKGPKGTGLGLSVCLSIVRLNQGDITIKSEWGVGTEVLLSFPLANGPSPNGWATSGDDSQKTLPLTLREAPPRRLRVIVVDDEDYVRALIQEILRRSLGWHVERAHNARAAIEYLQEESCDLVITDVRMAEMDGIAFYRWIQQNRPELAQRVIFVTGDAGSAELNGLLQELGRPVLRKPFPSGALLDQCRQVLAEAGHVV